MCATVTVTVSVATGMYVMLVKKCRTLAVQTSPGASERVSTATDDDVEMMTLTPSGPRVVTGLAAAVVVLRMGESPVTVWTSVVAGSGGANDEEEESEA